MKVKLLAAAAIMAIGVSAQAGGTATLGNYSLVTLPVSAGYNLYGICVDPIVAEAKLGDVLLVGDANLKYNGAASTTNETYVSSVKGVWLTGASESGTVYEFGKTPSAPTASDNPTVAAGAMELLAWPVDLTLANFSALESNSYKLANAKANWVHIWNAETQAYVKYYYKAGTGWRIQGSTASVTPANVTIPAGTAFYVQASTQAPATLTFVSESN